MAAATHTIAYVGAASRRGDALGLLDRTEGRRLEDGSTLFTVRGHAPYKKEYRFVELSTADEALRFVRAHPVDALIVDTRVRPFADSADNPSEGGDFSRTRAGGVLACLFPEGGTPAVPRGRTIGLVGDGRSGAQASFQLGQYQLQSVLSNPELNNLIESLSDLLREPAAGKVAICLAGGGIEGLFYELGVLRALDAFMENRAVVDVDLFCGISAGAVLGSFLANGVGPEEIARGLGGQSARVKPLRRSQMFDPNGQELKRRTLRLGAQLLGGGFGPRGALSSLARALPSAFFAGNGVRQWLRSELQRPGMSDRFAKLRRPLFVGATDQDTSEAVVFGEPPHDEVPIHQAVRASSALIPFYAPERIGDRYYIDGAFSRTTNMRVAVRQGATLVILIDPLVPTRSEQPGYVHARGGMFGTMQGLKALINGRFDKAQKAIREMYPEVSFLLFRPEGDEMRILSGSPMKYFFRREVEEIAFRNTTRKMRRDLPEITGAFARHGIVFRDPDEARHPSLRPSPISPGAFGVGV
ncbi:MAG: patatin-like phospholipase family protein [Myxococcota bacterium]